MKVKSVFENHYSHFREIILNFHVSCDIIHIFESEWRKEMPVSYDRLWKVLIDKKMTRTDLKDTSGVSFNVIAKMGRNEYVSMESLYKICIALNCGINDVVEFINNEND